MILGLLVCGSTAAAPAASAAQETCLVFGTNVNSSLQSAVNAASAGASLLVIGTCAGDTTVTKNVTITGLGATLNGGGHGTVLTIDAGATVTINSLIITGGTGSPMHNELEGGGIVNLGGTVTLNHSTVIGNGANSVDPSDGMNRPGESGDSVF